LPDGAARSFESRRIKSTALAVDKLAVFTLSGTE
jgi:hypothetical protein